MTDSLRQLLWPKGPRQDVFAIVDAAQDQKVYWELENSFLPHSCLFAGKLPEALEMASPYIVQLYSDDKFTDFLGANLGRSLGIFFRCEQGLAEVRRHLRRFLTVKDPAGRKMLFRYYDPRVLRIYLPTCTKQELSTVFGPIQTFWTEGEKPGEVIRFDFRGKELEVHAESVAGEAVSGGHFAPEIVPAKKVLVVPRDGGNAQRTPILIQGADRGGRLRVSSPGVRLFRSAVAAEEMSPHDGAYVVPPASLELDVTLYASAVEAGEATMTFESAQGGSAKCMLTAVMAGIETGPGLFLTGVSGTPRRRIEIAPPQPATYRGRLTLRTAPGGPALTLFTAENGAEGHKLADGFAFDAPAQTQSFWLEGSALSREAGDGRLQLFVDDVSTAADSRPYTVAAIGSFEVEIPATPAQTPRTAETVAPHVTRERQVVLLAGANDGESPVQLRVETTPVGLALPWHCIRAGDDGERAIQLSEQSVPTIRAEGSDGSLLTDAVGSFRIHAGGESGWGGPTAEWELILVHAAVTQNNTSLDTRFCGCARAAGSALFRLHSGPRPAVQLEAELQLTGGGPDGLRGLDRVRAGWVNNILSDNCGARYRGGVVRTAGYLFQKDGEAVSVDLDDGPLLDAAVAGERCVDGGETELLDSGRMAVRAELSPSTAWAVNDGGAPDRPIEQIWRYLECRSFLALWSTDAPETAAVAMQAGWSFTGDYQCTPLKTTRVVVPARVASTGAAVYVSPRPAPATGIEMRGPASGETPRP
jgi:hypothetical protein